MGGPGCKSALVARRCAQRIEMLCHCLSDHELIEFGSFTRAQPRVDENSTASIIYSHHLGWPDMYLCLRLPL